MEMIPHKDVIIKGIKQRLNCLPTNIGGGSEALIKDLKTHSNVYFCDISRLHPYKVEDPYDIIFNSSYKYDFYTSHEKIFDKFDEYLKSYAQAINKPINLTVKVSGPKDHEHFNKLKENSYIEKNFYPTLDTIVYDNDVVSRPIKENSRFALKLVDTDMVRTFIENDKNINIVNSKTTLGNTKRILKIMFDNEDYIMYLLPYIEESPFTQLIYFR